MVKLPFQLLIDCTFPKSKTESLTCTALLRAIAGRRMVYDAVWAKRPVIVKMFSHKIRAALHLKREWRGLTLLQKRRLSCPQPLFYGKTEDGSYAMVMEKIVDSSTALDVFNKAGNAEEKLKLLISICKEMAKQHSKGVLQKDLHLGNFLVKEEKIFTIDPTQMRFYRREVGRKKSLSQIALLALSIGQERPESIARLCREYGLGRGWSFDDSDMSLFRKRLAVHKKNGIRKELKKCLRTSKRQVRIKDDSWVAVFNRGFWQDGCPAEFVKQIDTIITEGRILKNGNTCTLSRVNRAGKNIVIKRYNHKGLVHSLRHTVKRSRARRGWLWAHRLGTLNIPTPKPVAYIEKRKGLIVWESYLVTEFVEGQNLHTFLQDSDVTKEQRSEAVGRIKELLDKLGREKITHGDLKQTNILITEDILTKDSHA